MEQQVIVLPKHRVDSGARLANDTGDGNGWHGVCDPVMTNGAEPSGGTSVLVRRPVQVVRPVRAVKPHDDCSSVLDSEILNTPDVG